MSFSTEWHLHKRRSTKIESILQHIKKNVISYERKRALDATFLDQFPDISLSRGARFSSYDGN